MSDREFPDYIKENDDGSLEVTLKKPHSFSGEERTVVTMREPTVDIQLNARKIAGKPDAAAVEMAQFALLCDCAPGDFKNMTMRDYTRLQTAYTFFID